MDTKSKIQRIIEQQAYRDAFFGALGEMVDKYRIKDSIFTYDRSTQAIKEATRGYFVPMDEYDDLKQCREGFDPSRPYVRVIESNKFQSGVVMSTVAECMSLPEIDDINDSEIISISRNAV